jgi:hypothetical protein
MRHRLPILWQWGREFRQRRGMGTFRVLPESARDASADAQMANACGGLRAVSARIRQEGTEADWMICFSWCKEAPRKVPWNLKETPGPSTNLSGYPTQALDCEKFSRERDSRTHRSRKSGKWLTLRLLLTTNERHEHPHFATTRARRFAPNHPIPISIIRRQISLRTVCLVVNVLTFGCGLRHWARSLQHVCTGEAKNGYSTLNLNWKSTLHIVFHT